MPNKTSAASAVSSLSPGDLKNALALVERGAKEGRLTAAAVGNLKPWLTEPRYAQFAPTVAEMLAAERWKELDDAFWTIIPFGTGGRRGKMFPVGSNTINERTIGESAQGLADYMKRWHASMTAMDRPLLACAIAYDTRHRSREFAELCAEVMAAAGFKVFFLDGYRSTPELSCAVRHKKCACGIMVTASHNPPSDNAVKAYGASGGQLLAPHDRGVIDCVMSVDQISRLPFTQGLKEGQIVYCQEEIDAVYLRSMVAQAMRGPRKSKFSTRRCMAWEHRRCCRPWLPTGSRMSSCMVRTPIRTAIFRTSSGMFPIRKTRRSSARLSRGLGKSGPTW